MAKNKIPNEKGQRQRSLLPPGENGDSTLATDAPEGAGGNDGGTAKPTNVDNEKNDLTTQELFLPVTGFVMLCDEEKAVINHPCFQRLGRIYQLGQTYLVYRGATHKRLEHALGTLYIVQRMIDALEYTSKKNHLLNKPGAKQNDATLDQKEQRESEAKRNDATLNPKERCFVRLGALLHDIGHVAIGHTLEDELGLIGKHDSNERLQLLFEGKDADDNTLKKGKDADGNTLAQLINEKFKNFVPKEIRDQVKASDIVRLLITKPPKETKEEAKEEAKEETKEKTSANNEKNQLSTSEEETDSFDYQKIDAIIKKAKSFIRVGICRDMIGNTICADLLDYLHRDWYHIGKPKYFDERVLQYMEIRSTGESHSTASRADHRFVISLGKNPKIRTDAISSILELLEWRYQIAESVLFHRTKLTATAMLDRALYMLYDGKKPDKLEQEILFLSDEEFLEFCVNEAGKQQKGEGAKNLLLQLQNRQLFASLCAYSYDELGNIRQRVLSKYATTPKGGKIAARQHRMQALSRIEEDFDLPSGCMAMYCPDDKMNAKIAEVQIAVGDHIDTFSNYEEKNLDRLSGGHLKAQLARFKRLWKVHFFIDRNVAKEKGEEFLSILRDAVQILVLDYFVNEERKWQASHRFAKELSLLPDSGKKLKTKEQMETVIAAYRKYPEGNDPPLYPFGAPSLRSFFDESSTK